MHISFSLPVHSYWFPVFLLFGVFPQKQNRGELEPEGIRIINFNKLSAEEGKLLEKYFDAHIAPFLSPMIIGKQQPFPFLANKQLYAIVLLETPKGKRRTGLVPCSNSVFKRLIEIPTRPGTFMLSEELILHFVSKLYSKYIVKEKSIMRVTRNADIDATEIYDEDLVRFFNMIMSFEDFYKIAESHYYKHNAPLL